MPRSRRAFLAVGLGAGGVVVVQNLLPRHSGGRRSAARPTEPIAVPTRGRQGNRSSSAGGAPDMPNPWAMTVDGRWVPSASGRSPSTAQLRAWFRSMVVCGRRTLHVSGHGNDTRSGAADAPLRQISTAVRRARPGDLILVDNGTYGYTEVRDFRGGQSAWLGIMTKNDDVRAVINVPPPTDNFVNVVSSHYVGLYGFEIRGDQANPNTNGSGISVYGNSHHIALWNNRVHDFPGGGINCFDVDGSHDLIDISFNTVHATSRYSPNNTSGISIFKSQDLTGGAVLPGGYGYRIVGNYVYDVECRVPFAPGGFTVVTDGNGISLDSLTDAYGYTKPILVAANLITGCGGRGVLAQNTVNVDVVENTAVGNLRTNSPAITGGVELEGKTDRTVRHLRNAICPINTPNSTDLLSTYVGNVVLGGSQSVPDGNVDGRRRGLRYFVGPVTAAAIRSGTNPSVFRSATG